MTGTIGQGHHALEEPEPSDAVTTPLTLPPQAVPPAPPAPPPKVPTPRVGPEDRTDAPPDARYAAFISYSHRDDRDVARTLQGGIERYATAKRRGRTSTVFLDDANLAASPDLWGSVEEALRSSQWLIVLASPGSAQSFWVGREIAWWLQYRGWQSILLVLTRGDLAWSSGARDFTAESAALHPHLLGVFPAEPFWIDVRREAGSNGERGESLESAIVSLTAKVRDVRKDELFGQHIAVQREAARRTRVVVVTLSVLLVAALIAAVLAVTQRNRAVEQTQLAVSRQLAATAGSRLDTDLDTGALLAVTAFRQNPNAETRAALVRAATASPRLVRYVPFTSTVNTVVGSDDGSTVVAGLQDGRVTRAGATAGPPTDLMRLPGAATTAATGGDGQAVLATDGHQAMLVRGGLAPVTLPLPAGYDVHGVSVSPSGRTATLSLTPGGQVASYDTGLVALVDVPSGRVGATRPTAAADLLQLPSDQEVLAFSRTYGQWEKHRIADWSMVAASPEGMFGTYNFAHAVARNGGTIAQSNGGNALNIWTTTGPSSFYQPQLEARAPVNFPDALALSPDGSQLAAAEGGAITVSPVGPRSSAGGAPLPLTGVGDVNPGTLQFAGDGSRLISASGTKLAVWDLRQLDRLARTFPTAESTSCRACPGPRVVVSPDGTRAAALAGDGNAVGVQALQGGQPDVVETGLFDSQLAPPAWTADGSRIVVPVMPLTGGSSSDPLPAPPPVVSASWSVGDGAAAQAVRISPGGEAVVVTDKGGVLTQDATTGAVRDRLAPPVALAEGVQRVESGAVSDDTRLVAVAGRGAVIVTDRVSHTTTATIPGGASSVVFAGDRLLVARADGAVEVWSADGTLHQRTIAGSASYTGAPVASPTGTLMARQRPDASTDLVDLDTGAVLGTLTAVGGTEGRKTGSGFGRRNELVSVTEPADLGDSTMAVRDLSDDGLVAQACRLAGRDLTGEEWDAYAGTDRPDDLRCR